MRSSAELVQRLGSSRSSSERQQAAAALLALPMTPQTWVTAVGAFPALVQMLTQPTGSATARQLAALVLQRVANHPYEDMSTVLPASGSSAAALVPLMQHSLEDVCIYATKTLSSLAWISINRRLIRDAGAIVPLVHLLRCSTLPVHSSAARTLAFLSLESGFRVEIIAAGAVPLLVHWIKSSSSHTVQRPAAMALRSLSYDFENTVVVADAGAVIPLARLLTSGCVAVQEEAMQALGYLAGNSDIIGPIVAAGAIPLITALLSSTPERV